MAETRTRRIVRRAAMGLTACVLMVGAYVGSVATLILATQAGWIPKAVTESGAPGTYATPLLWYSANSDLPGSSLARTVVRWSVDTGRVTRNR